MKRFIVFIFTMIFVISAFAQTGKVSFSLIDSQTKQGVMGAVVEVYPTAKPDNKKYYTSGANGYVSIPGLAYGNYTMIATFIGYKDLTKTFRVSGESLSLGKLIMTEEAERIETVVKTVKALRTSQNGDTLSYSAGAFKVSNDADVEGLLKKMPGITINNGAVEAQGETIQKIFVDGKEFFGEDVSTAIKSLPAEAVDRIEVFNKLSDQAEFSGMDDGEGFKAINIVTKEGMRQGQFGKMYAGVGYEPDWKTNNAEDFAKGHKWIVGGNVNFFQGDARVSLIGLFNNVNQQNFSFEDILGVSGANQGGGSRRGQRGMVGQYMVRPQNGIALVNSLGANYSDEWGRRKNVKFQGSLFFNNTDTENKSRTEKWYESPMPIGFMRQQGFSNTINYNARFNARLDWKISRNTSLMSRTGFSYQNNGTPKSWTEGFTIGENEDAEELEGSKHQPLSYTYTSNWSDMQAFNFNEFLMFRAKLGKPGRTISVSGRISYQNNERKQKTSANDASGIPYSTDADSDYQKDSENYFGEGKSWQEMASNSALYSPLYQYIHRPSEEIATRANITYNEPISQYSQISLQYRMWYEKEVNDKQTFYTNENWGDRQKNDNMSQAFQSGFWTHRVGPGFRFAKNRNTVVLNLSYQRDILNGNIVGSQGDKIDKTYNHFSYFGMANIAFNKENTLRIFLRSWSGNPSVTQLQSIFDVSNPQYISIGNKNLNPSFTHNLSMHYNLSKVDKGITFMWMFNAQYQQDYISQSVWNNPQGWDLPSNFGDLTIPMRKDEAGNEVAYRPKEVTSYENMDGYYSVRTHVSLGVPLSFMKCNLNIKGGVVYSQIPSAIYVTPESGNVLQNMIDHKFQTNYANNIGYDAGVTLGSNISENLDFTVSWNGTYNQAWNTIGQTAKNKYFNHSVNGNIKWTFLKRLTVTAAVSYVQYLGFTNKYNEDYVLCNFYLGCKVFKNKRGEVQVGVNDILNQNTSFARTTGSGYTQNAWNSCIGRYFSVQFVYNLRHFGKKGSTKMSDYGYKESTGSVGVNRGTSSGGFWRGPR